MDYRLTAIRDHAVRMVTQHREAVESLRASTQGSRETNTSAELAIARSNGGLAAWQQIVDQFNGLDAVQLPPPGGAKDETASSTGGSHSGTIRGCSACTNDLRILREQFDRMVSEANGYGWNDSDCQNAKARARDLITSLANNLSQH